MKNKIVKTLIIIVLLMTFTLTNFLSISVSAISYAANIITTNHQNVEFDVSFKDAEGGKVKEINKTFQEELSIYININVKKEGYLNGVITLQDSNFKLIDTKSSYVNKIEDNKIYLNQINAEETPEIEVKIEPIKEEKLKIGLLDMKSSFQLSGTYKDSTQKDTQIEQNREVILKLVSPDMDSHNIINNLDIITNNIYDIDGKQKRIIQIALKVGLENNIYPMKKIEAQIPDLTIDGKQPEIETIVKSNNMTNWNTRIENGKVLIELENKKEETNEVNWKENGQEEIVITYIHEEDIKIEDTALKAITNVMLYDEKQSTSESNEIILNQNEMKDGIYHIEIEKKDTKIYKGGIYAGLDRVFQTKTKLDIRFAEVNHQIQIEEHAASFLGEELQEEAQVHYVSSKVNKEQFLNIFGETGKIVILNENLIVTQIDKDSQEDENGDICVYYEPNVKAISIKTTNPMNTGILEIVHDKVIKQVDENIAKQSNTLASNIKLSYQVEQISKEITQKEFQIELAEPKTEAGIELSKTNLATLEENKDVEIRVKLKSFDERNNLYKNPVIQIELPEELEEIKVKSIDKIHADEFHITSAKLIELDYGKKAIRMDLEGTQTTYSNNIIGGAQITMQADMTFKKTTPSKETQIVLNYLNENRPEEQYQEIETIKLSSKQGMLVYSEIDNFNQNNDTLETVKQEVLKGTLDTHTESKTIDIKRTIINNYDEPLKDLNIIGNLGTEGAKKILGETVDNTIESTLVGVEVSKENVKIYYAPEENVAQQNDAWQENVTDLSNMKSYKVELGEEGLAPGEVLEVTYHIQVPENLDYNNKMYEMTNIMYAYNQQNMVTTAATQFATQELENTTITQIEGLGEVKVKASTVGKNIAENEAVFEGQEIIYDVTIINNTNKEVEQVKMNVKHPNANLYDIVESVNIDSTTYEEYTVYYYQEIEGLTEKTYDFGTLESGQSKTLEYRLRVAKGSSKLTGTIAITGENVKEKSVETTKHEVKKGDLKLEILHLDLIERNFESSKPMNTELAVNNISEVEQKNVIVEFDLPEGMKLAEFLPEDNHIVLEQTEDKLKVEIKSIAQGETALLPIILDVRNMTPDKKADIAFYFTAKLKNDIYTSNLIKKVIEKEVPKMQIKQQGSISGEFVEDKDKLTYQLTVTNPQETTRELQFYDNVPSVARIQRAYYIKEGKQITLEVNKETNAIFAFDIEIEPSEKITFMIETIIDEEYATEVTFENEATVSPGDTAVTSNIVSYKVKSLYDKEKEDNDDDDDNNNPEIVNRKDVSGEAWLDENKDGVKDETEAKLGGIKVKLININTEETIDTITSQDGTYKFKDVIADKYVVIFEYDTLKYSPTQYKKAGISDAADSDVMSKKVRLNNQEVLVAVTEEIDVLNTNTEHIDAGFIEKQVFDLALDKSISKVMIENASGISVREYNTKLAKVELDAKQVNGSKVSIAYNIVVKNEGEVAGYANEVVDYLPEGLTFHAADNPDWVQKENRDLYNTSLDQEIIEPGASKTITLILTKEMTESNMGLIANTAEIAKSSNDLSIEDIDSVAGNKMQGEDDMSTAEIIISIRTGLAMVITSIILIGMILVGSTIYIVRRKRGKVDEKFKI